MTTFQKSFSEALVAAQADIKNAGLNKTNPHFKKQYADLAAIREAIIPALAKHGLTVTQLMDIRDGQTVLVTKMLHKTGEYMDSVFPLHPEKQTPQSMGSAITYARRYCLAAIGGIAAEEDDDGNAAGDKSNQRKPSEPTQAQKDGAEEIRQAVMACERVVALDDLAGTPSFKARVSVLPTELGQMVRREWSDRKAWLKSKEATESSNDELTGGNAPARELGPLNAG